MEAEIEAARERHEEAISTPRAIAERERSTEAFEGISRSEAIDLALGRFEEQLETLLTLPTAPLLSSESPPEFRSDTDFVARVDPPGAEDSALVVSNTPLRTDDDVVPDGALAPEGDGFAPKRPLAEAVIPGEATGEIEFPDVGVSFGFDSAAASPGRLIDAAPAAGREMVFFADTDKDTDTAISYTLSGVETFHYLRSARSPESLGLDYRLPDGAELAEAADGGVNVIDQDGEALLGVYPPYAVDAQGSSVPVEMSAEGDSIVIEVPHRGRDFAYPIMVDPIQHVRDWWSNGANPGFDGWSFEQLGSTQYQSSLSCPSQLASVDPCAGTGAGVYASMVPGKSYAADSRGYWRWSAPGGSTSSIKSATVDTWRYRKGNQAAGYAYYKLVGGTSVSFPDGGGGNGLYLVGADSGIKYLDVGLATANAATMPTGAANWRYARIGAYTATLTDGEAPSLTLTDVPTNWLGPDTNFTINGISRDPGLGLHWMSSTINNGPGVTRWLGWCTGTYPYTCPTATVEQPITFNTNNLAIGVNSVAVKSTDAVGGTGHDTIESVSVKVDRTAPQVLSINPLLINDRATVAERFLLSFEATDDLSGIQDLEFSINDDVIYEYRSACDDGETCIPDLAGFVVDLHGQDETRTGIHDWELRLTDSAGNISVKSGTLSVDQLLPNVPAEQPEFMAEPGEIASVGIEGRRAEDVYNSINEDPEVVPEPESLSHVTPFLGPIRVGLIKCFIQGPSQGPLVTAVSWSTWAQGGCVLVGSKPPKFDGVFISACVDRFDGGIGKWRVQRCKTRSFSAMQMINSMRILMMNGTCYESRLLRSRAEMTIRMTDRLPAMPGTVSRYSQWCPRR